MSGKRKVSKKTGWKAISSVKTTPYDYSGDGRKEEQMDRDNERNHEVIGRDGRMK